MITPWGSPDDPDQPLLRRARRLVSQGQGLHANVDAQFGGADNWIYRTDPTELLQLPGNVSYAPRPWLMLGGNFIFQQGKNNAADINFNQHNYITMVNATIMPNKHWGFDLAYNFDAIQQNTILCFAGQHASARLDHLPGRQHAAADLWLSTRPTRNTATSR